MIVPTVNLTKSEVELRLDQIYAAFRKIEVLALQNDALDTLSIIAVEASDGKFQTVKLLEDLYKEIP